MIAQSFKDSWVPHSLNEMQTCSSQLWIKLKHCAQSSEHKLAFNNCMSHLVQYVRVSSILQKQPNWLFLLFVACYHQRSHSILCITEAMHYTSYTTLNTSPETYNILCIQMFAVVALNN